MFMSTYDLGLQVLHNGMHKLSTINPQMTVISAKNLKYFLLDS